MKGGGRSQVGGGEWKKGRERGDGEKRKRRGEKGRQREDIKGGEKGRKEKREERGWEGGRRVHELPVLRMNTFCLPAPLYKNMTSEAAVYTCVNIHYNIQL